MTEKDTWGENHDSLLAQIAFEIPGSFPKENITYWNLKGNIPQKLLTYWWYLKPWGKGLYREEKMVELTLRS